MVCCSERKREDRTHRTAPTSGFPLVRSFTTCLSQGSAPPPDSRSCCSAIPLESELMMNLMNSVFLHRGSLRSSFILEKQKQNLRATFLQRRGRSCRGAHRHGPAEGGPELRADRAGAHMWSPASVPRHPAAGRGGESEQEDAEGELCTLYLCKTRTKHGGCTFMDRGLCVHTRALHFAYMTDM